VLYKLVLAEEWTGRCGEWWRTSSTCCNVRPVGWYTENGGLGIPKLETMSISSSLKTSLKFLDSSDPIIALE
jgi:hypothetical protein